MAQPGQNHSGQQFHQNAQRQRERERSRTNGNTREREREREREQPNGVVQEQRQEQRTNAAGQTQTKEQYSLILKLAPDNGEQAFECGCKPRRNAESVWVATWEAMLPAWALRTTCQEAAMRNERGRLDTNTTEWQHMGN